MKSIDVPQVLDSLVSTIHVFFLYQREIEAEQRFGSIKELGISFKFIVSHRIRSDGGDDHLLILICNPLLLSQF